MSEQENVQLILKAYEAFGRGDIQGVLDALTEDVEWFSPGPPDILPWAGARRGREAVAKYFGMLGQAIQFEKLEPQAFIAQGDKVAVIVEGRARATATGRTYENSYVHYFTIRDGRASAVRFYEDTYMVVEAVRDL